VGGEAGDRQEEPTEHAPGASLWANPGDSVVAEPGTGLLFVDLSHPWGTQTPVFPGYPDIKIHRSVTHASHGVMSQHIRTVMHNGTHVNAPVHLVQGGVGVGDIALDRFFGSGVVLPVHKYRWGLVEAGDLDATGIDVHAGDIVIVDTGWHRWYSDSQEYFGEAPGLSLGAAEWLVDRGAKLVGADTAQVDHPMATSLGRHRNGPIIRGLPERYEEAFGRAPEADFPDWNPAHRALLSAGIPTIENVGGALDRVTGKRCTFHAYPWGWAKGDACVVRLTAIFDPSGDYRIGAGQ
jgi:kynurenine formamidase